MRLNTWLFVVITISMLLFGLSAQGQTFDRNVLLNEIDQLSARVEQVDEGVSNDKEKYLQQLKDAEQLIVDATDFAEKVDGFEESVKQSNLVVEELKQQSKALSAQSVSKIEGDNNEQLSNKLMLSVAKQNALLAELSELQNKQSILSLRSSAIAEELVTAKKTLTDINDSLTKLESDEADMGANVTNLLKHAKAFKLQSTITNLEREVSTIPARQSLVSAQLGLVREQISFGEKRIAATQAYLDVARSTEASSIVKSAKDTLTTVGDNQALQSLAKENISLANKFETLVMQAPEVEKNTSTLRLQLVEIKQSAQTIERVLATGRVTDELGELLRRLRSSLPNESRLEQRKDELEEQIVREQLNIILWQDKLRNPDSQQLSADLASEEVNNQDDLVLLQTINSSRSTLLELLIEASNSHTDRLADLALQISSILVKSNELRILLDRNLVWLPSNTGIADNIWPNFLVSVEWLLSPYEWLQVIEDLWTGVMKSPVLTVLPLCLALLIFLVRGVVKRSLKKLILHVGNVSQDTYWTTPLALLETFVLALPLPIVLGTIAALIASQAEPQGFSNAIATALAAVSSLSLILLFFRSMCRSNGIFAGHFGWGDQAREELRGLLTWFAWWQCMVVFFFAASIASSLIELRYGLAIYAFIAGSIGISVFCYKFFKLKGGIASHIVGNTPATPVRVIAFSTLVTVPLAIGLLPVFGFFDTAVELQSKLFQSGVILIVAAVLYGIIFRIFMVAYRRFSLRRLIALRAEEQEIREQREEAEASGDALPVETTNEPPNNEEVKRQSRSVLIWIVGILCLISLWFIWMPLIPALGIVDEIVLWQRVSVVDGIEVSSGVSLWNIILSVTFLIGGFVAAKNLRGVFEVGFLERFKLDPGARYATIAILEYVVIGLGIVIGFSQLGIDWSKLQWVVAALGVGLGFGLQEIVANFVSGLIILFERPIRVGDTVTIGTLSGTVSNIKIRATTITDFDNREVLLPNKSIITENVTNWTLNDSVTRILLTVGVAYGSDVSAVRDLLMKAVEDHPDVLKSPPPQVFFMSHGDSSLDFEIRAFIDHPTKRLPMTHEINTLINQKLIENGFEIPFPQRDIHIRTGAETVLEAKIESKAEKS